MPMIY